MLSLTHITKTYGSRKILDNVTLQVTAGEQVALLGPNGVGKSTCLKIAAGLVKPDSGQIHIVGKTVDENLVETRMNLGYIPDVGGLFPRLTGIEHLELTARLHNLEAWERESLHLLETLGLNEASRHKAGTYSHGMSRKLAVAMAVLPNPAVLLLDEPFDGVDPSGSKTIRGLIKEQRARNCAVVCSTHLLDVVEKDFQRMIVLANGQIKGDGDRLALQTQTGCETLEDTYEQLTVPPTATGGATTAVSQAGKGESPEENKTVRSFTKAGENGVGCCSSLKNTGYSRTESGVHGGGE